MFFPDFPCLLDITAIGTQEMDTNRMHESFIGQIEMTKSGPQVNLARLQYYSYLISDLIDLSLTSLPAEV